MKRHLSTIVVIIIFLCGLSLFLYPTLSNLYNERMNDKMLSDYTKVVEGVKNEEYENAKKEAKLYNKHLNDKTKLKELKLNYSDVLNIMGDGAMGYIEIPKISVTLMIYHTVDEDNLQDGIGHVEGTALPIGGKNTHSILAGHTGLPSAKLLTNLDRMQIGDKFYINVLGKKLEYKVDNIAVVLPEDTSLTQVEKDKDLVTLVTCTPYGINSHRLLVRGVRNDGKGSDTIKEGAVDIEGDVVNIQMRYMITCTLTGLVLIFIAVYGFISIIRKRRKGGE